MPPPIVMQDPAAEAEELYQRGRRKQTAGALMVGLGLATMILVSTVHFFPDDEQRGWSRYDTRSHGESLGVGTSLGLLVGGLTMVAGLPVAIMGDYEIERARHLRASMWAPYGIHYDDGGN
jgi:hypothetical protein